MEDSVPVASPQEPPTTTGKLAEDVAGREETTAVVECKFLDVLRFQNADSYFNNFNDRLNSA